MGLIQVIVAFGVFGYAVIRAHASRYLSRGHAGNLEATFLFHLSSSLRERLWLELRLREEVQALWRRGCRLWTRRRRRCCRRRRRRLDQQGRLIILGGEGSAPTAGTWCSGSRNAAAAAATAAAPSRKHRRVRHLPSTNVCG